MLIERELHSSSDKLVWDLIGTAEGLSRWMADDARQEGDSIIFSWGKPWETHEVRRADIIAIKKRKFIRFKWNDEDDPDAYTEIRIDRLDMSDNIMLVITDFTESGEEPQMEKMWNHDLDRLHSKTGL